MTETIERVGVVGAGQMGAGIAEVFAAAGYSVKLGDISADALSRARATIAAGLERRVGKGAMTSDQASEALSRIGFVEGIAEFDDRQLVIEAATENEAAKGSIFTSLAAVLPADTIVATNTSSLSITRLAARSRRPDRFVGLHFMNPVVVMELVEVIRGQATSQATYDCMLGVVARLGKVAANVADSPAFLVNRLLIPMINEAVFALAEGVASVETIDDAMRLGANMPMGPLRLADLIGLDTCLAIMQVLHREFGDPKYRPCQLLVKYVDAGWLGRKSGRGFYPYSLAMPAA